MKKKRRYNWNGERYLLSAGVENKKRIYLVRYKTY